MTADGGCAQGSNCYSCGDPINVDKSYPPDIQDAMRCRCRTCAMEVLGIPKPIVRYDLVEQFKSVMRDSHTKSKVSILHDRYVLQSLKEWLVLLRQLSEAAEARRTEIGATIQDDSR